MKLERARTAMPIAYFVHGRGRGHASRARVVVPEVARRGHDVWVFGGGHSIPLLEGLPRFEAMEAVGPGPRLAERFARRFRADLRVLRALRPGVVVSDGDGPSVHAALRLGIPSVAVGHGMLYAQCRLPRDLPPVPRIREALNSLSSSWPSSRRVVVHFHPVAPLLPGTIVARPDLPPETTEADPTDEGFVLAYFRDDNGRALVERLVARGHRVVVFGAAGSAPPGVERHDPSPVEFARRLARCRAVVGSAGNHLPAECAMLGKPMLAVWADGDGEHRMNARLVEDAGIGVAAPLSGVRDDAIDRFLGMRPLPREQRPILRMRPASSAIPDAIESLGFRA